MARLIGGVIEAKWKSRQKSEGKGGDITLVVIASGFVLGEGVISIATLALRSYGIGALTCWGCGHGLCSGCPGG
jgi:uncharacterized oligopeptide transporter (OPT) family protein